MEVQGNQQTGKESSWISEAHKNDTSLGRHLGTLGFLPLEIREQIWCATIHNYKQDFWQNHVRHIEERDTRRRASSSRRKPWVDRSLDCHSSYPGPRWPWRRLKCHHTIIGLDVFDLSSYHNLSENSTEGGAMHLRYASPEAKVELENMFVYTNAFRFFCPKVMDHFLSQLSAYQRSLLRSITICLLGCPYCPPENVRYLNLKSNRAWLKPIRQAWLKNIERLPATLKSVTFGFESVGLSIPRTFAWDRGKREDFLLATEVLEMTTKKMRRQAPGAEISLKALENLKSEDSDFLQSTFNEVEPYSEGFKQWTIQSWRDAMNQEAEKLVEIGELCGGQGIGH